MLSSSSSYNGAMPYKDHATDLAYHVKYRAENIETQRAYQRVYRTTPEGIAARERARDTPKAIQTASVYRISHKLKIALRMSGWRARKGGYMPVDITTIRPPHPDGCCDHCFKKPSKRGLCLDHDHLTGKFRGWLCNRCNSAFGTFGDCSKGMQIGIDYLQGHRHRPLADESAAAVSDQKTRFA